MVQAMLYPGSVRLLFTNCRPNWGSDAHTFALCNSTYVFVSAYNNITKDAPGAPTSQKRAELYYWNYDYCNGTMRSSGYGSVINPEFTIDKQLNSATLNETFTVYDESSGTQKSVDVALTWTGTGDTYRGNSHYHYQGPGYMSNYRSVGSDRNAQVSGSVTLDGTNIIENLSSFSLMNSSNSGSVTVTRK